MKITSLFCLALTVCLGSASAQSIHGVSSRFASYEGRVMCGYQGWSRAPSDGANEGWGHYAARGRFDSEHVRLDFWPDVAEYEKTYLTALTNADGTAIFKYSNNPPPWVPNWVILRACPRTTTSG